MKYLMVISLIFAGKIFAYSTIAISPTNATHPQMSTSATATSVNAILAEDAALTLCKKRGGVKCQPFNIYKLCLAVAMNDDDYTFFTSSAMDQGEAQVAALTKCRNESKKPNCSLRTSVCDRNACDRERDFNACLKRGDAIQPGTAKEFCRSQFC